MRQIKFQIKFKLLVAFLLLMIITIAAVTYFINDYFRTYYQQELEFLVQTIGRNASAALRFPLFHGDYNQLEKIVQPLMQKDFAYMIVFDHRQKVVAFLEDPENNWPNLRYEDLKFHDDEAFQIIKIGQRNFFEYHFPIKFVSDQTPSGCVIVGIAGDLIASKLSKARNRILMIGMISILLSGLFIYLLTALITTPLKKLTTGIQQFTSGNYQQRIEIKGRDEVGELATSFNQMAETISQQIQDIEKYSKELETLVESRTEALVKTMQELNQKEKELLKKEKMEGLRNLVNAISHEINNPLTIIYGNLQFLKAKGSAEEIEKRMPQIEASVVRINNLLKDMMFFSSLREITMNSFSAGLVIDDLIKKVVPEGIEVKVSDQIGELVFANEVMLAMVFSNILENSVQELKAAEASAPRIEIALQSDAKNYYFTFQDNGPGAEDPQRIFDPFYTTHPEKRGLGLTYVSYIVDLHEGRVAAKNLNPGFEIKISIPRLI